MPWGDDLRCDHVARPCHGAARHPRRTYADLFRKHGFTSIPVVEKGGVLLGVIFQLDLIRRARRDAMRANTSFGARMAAIRRDRSVGIIRASEIMTTGLPTVVATTPVASLMPLLSDGGAEVCR